MENDVDKPPNAPRSTPGSILLVAVWIGLIAGFADLGLLVLKKRLFDNDFYRLGEGFPWIIPAGVTALLLVPGVALALVACLRRRAASLGMVVGFVSFVGFLDLSAKLPLEFWASILLSAGLAVQSARLARARPGFLRLARVTTPVLAVAVLALMLATSGARAWSEHRTIAALPRPPSASPNVLLIVWDTVRAGNLSLYGHGRRTTPNLEVLAAKGVRFRHAFSTSSWTLPSHASMFTGRWPHELSAGWKAPLDGTHPTLAERLTALGYDTAGFVANLDYCSSETGLNRGFAHYEDYPLSVREVVTRYVGLGRRIDPFSIALVAETLSGRRRREARPLLPISLEHAKRALDVDRGFLNWLSWQRKRGRPFFAFLNYNDAHTPYEVPDDSNGGFGLRPSSWNDRLIFHQWNTLDKMKVPYRNVLMANDLYDDSIAYLDQRLGALLGELERSGVLERTVVIVTSDHGEHLGDHALFFHGCSLYRQVVEVPLVIVAPNGVPAGLALEETVSLRDLPATVLAVLGLGRDGAFPGNSLSRYWASRGSGPLHRSSL